MKTESRTANRAERIDAEGIKKKKPGRRGLPGAFWALAAAQVVSLFGNAVLRFALPLHVLGSRAPPPSWAR